MVETISPVVHGGRNRSYWTSIAMHVLGATGAAAAFGALVGGAGALVGAPWGSTGAYLVAVIALVYLLREAFRLPIPTFDRKQQVPEWWRTFYSRPVASLLYGVGLGVGFATYLTFGTFVVVAAGTFATGDAAIGALISGAFGASRAAAVAAAGSRSDLDEVATTPVPRRWNAGVLAALALVAMVSATV